MDKFVIIKQRLVTLQTILSQNGMRLNVLCMRFVQWYA